MPAGDVEIATIGALDAPGIPAVRRVAHVLKAGVVLRASAVNTARLVKSLVDSENLGTTLASCTITESSPGARVRLA